MKMLSERGGRQAGGEGVMLARGVFRDNPACWGDVTALPGCPTCAGDKAQATAGAASWTSCVGGSGRGAHPDPSGQWLVRPITPSCPRKAHGCPEAAEAGV